MDLQLETKNSLILVTNDGMGNAEEELRKTLIKTYFQLLIEHDILPAVICFYARGIKMAVDGSPILDELKALQDAGVHLVLCSTCVNYYGLRDQVNLGVMGGMTDILEAQIRAEKVISL